MRSATSEHVSLSDVSRKDAERATLVASRGLHRGLHHMLIRDPSGTSEHTHSSQIPL